MTKIFSASLKETNLIREDVYKVLSHTLVQPRKEFLVRPLDPGFVNKLKFEILERPTNFVKPMIAIVKNAKSKSEFDESKLDGYTLEVIGGNHRREAFSQLEKEGKLGEMSPLLLQVQLYTEMLPEHALRLAQMHNRDDSVHHKLTTGDKVTLCKNLLLQQFGGKKCPDWRNLMSTIIGESETALSNVFFAASDLNDAVYDSLLNIMEMYGKMELKKQRASKKALKEGTAFSCKLDFPYIKLKCLRGDLTQDEILNLLQKLMEKEFSLPEMESEITRMKEMRALQNYFVKQADCISWTEAKERYPNYTSEEVLQGFRGSIVRGVPKETFRQFVRRALAEQSAQSPGCEDEKIKIILMDCLTELTHSSLAESVPTFNGASLVFTDLPKKWTADNIGVFTRLMKSVNLRNGVDNFRFILFPTIQNEDLMVQQIQATSIVLKSMNLEWHITYFENSLPNLKGKDKLKKVIFPFIVSGSSSIEVEAATNIFRVDGEPLAKEVDSGIKYTRQKPIQLYCELIKVFCHDKSLYIVDACSGAGSCAMACSKLGLKCIVLDNSALKLRLIRQRLGSI
ncbi:uncharacterized protein LOC114541406 [Dendronephthya gigantea]|uniref:uncharacterized protein LOC114541406 n=1 Tax=Dendronephthya gigantea TaxID=151771 RepID=UPI00106DB812|nr:uncharacterized protein LOC114541406 [Dendronephthya gigantea]XP_028417132.1 uncharacterized protein LOC114541406 [Dendronephthya gigantea]